MRKSLDQLAAGAIVLAALLVGWLTAAPIY
jgi:hypothetical protein